MISVDKLKTNSKYKEMVPPLSKEDYANLKDSIEADGVEIPLILNHNNLVLDGHHRLQICHDLGIHEVDYRKKYFTNQLDEEEFVISCNLNRRHLNNAQKAELGLKILEIEERKAKERQGKRNDLSNKNDSKGNIVENSPQCLDKNKDEVTTIFNAKKAEDELKKPMEGRAVELAAKKAGISDNTLKRVKKIKKAAEDDPRIMEKWEKAKKGNTTVNAVYRAVQDKEKPIKRQAIVSKLPEGEFTVILADPPWKYNFSETKNREIENHYPTMDLEAIKKLNPPKADDSILYLWATAPKLEEALEVISAWGFEYKTNMVWCKNKIGMGYYARSQHELILIATNGNGMVPPTDKRVSSVFKAPRTEHSRKPDYIHELIESMFPGEKYLELFARRPRDGWKVWGDEI